MRIKNNNSKNLLSLAASLEKIVHNKSDQTSENPDIKFAKKPGNFLKLKEFANKTLSSRKVPKSKVIDVSIVIPVFNKLEFTANCLDGLSIQKSIYNFEVIVIDNNSDDGTKEVLSGIPGLIYHRSNVNLGFVDGSNLGARLAKGRVLVFLNNDTIVQEGWLDNLVGTLESDESIGLVGSKLIYPNGVLQEAGGIIFSDGSGANYGKHSDSLHFLYNYVREVDYCSGASIAIHNKLFKSLKCFDRLFAPAYYEDADLAMKVRKAGKKVVYQPRSVVVHIEGATSGTDINSGFKRFQKINKDKFIKKWSKELSLYHHKPSGNILSSRSYGKRPSILFVDSIVPEYDKDAGSLRMFTLIKAAVDLGYNVTFFPDNRVATLPYTADLQNLGVEVIYGELNMRELYRSRANLYDYVFLSRPLESAWHLDLCKSYSPKSKIIYDTVDLHFLRVGRQAKLSQNKQLEDESKIWKELEIGLMEKSDSTIVVSTEEKQLLKKEVDVKINIIPTLNIKRYGSSNPKFSERSNILFIGSSHPPNEDAVLWFMKEVFPLVKKQLPAMKITLLGSNPSSNIRRLKSSSVEVPGFVENVDGYFNSARVFICPMRYGAGVKGKVSQALSYGLPVVSTSIGAEGMNLKDDKNCVIANTAEQFANSLIKLYSEEKYWNKIRAGSIEVFEKYFSEAAGVEAFKNALKNT